MKKKILLAAVLVTFIALGSVGGVIYAAGQSTSALSKPIAESRWYQTTFLGNHVLTDWAGDSLFTVTDEPFTITYQRVGQDFIIWATPRGMFSFASIPGENSWSFETYLHSVGRDGRDELWHTSMQLTVTDQDLPWTDSDDNYKGLRWVGVSHDDIYEVRETGSIQEGPRGSEQPYSLYGIVRADSQSWAPVTG